MGMTSSDVRAAISKKFDPEQWAVFFEVAHSTGAIAPRRADAIAMNLWPSRGHTIHGFEIKVSRSDWQTELKKPQKADPFLARCDFWWIVTPPGIVRLDELPPTWGLYEVTGRGLTVKASAPKIEGPTLDRGFVASLLRCANKMDGAERARLVREALATDAAGREAEIKRQVELRSRNDVALRQRVADFEKASGIDLSNSFGDMRELGHLVKMVRLIGSERVYRSVRQMHGSVLELAGELKKNLDEFDGHRERAEAIERAATGGPRGEG